MQLVFVLICVLPKFNFHPHPPRFFFICNCNCVFFCVCVPYYIHHNLLARQTTYSQHIALFVLCVRDYVCARVRVDINKSLPFVPHNQHSCILFSLPLAWLLVLCLCVCVQAATTSKVASSAAVAATTAVPDQPGISPTRRTHSPTVCVRMCVCAPIWRECRHPTPQKPIHPPPPPRNTNPKYENKKYAHLNKNNIASTTKQHQREQQTVVHMRAHTFKVNCTIVSPLSVQIIINLISTTKPPSSTPAVVVECARTMFGVLLRRRRRFFFARESFTQCVRVCVCEVSPLVWHSKLRFFLPRVRQQCYAITANDK